MSTTAIAFSALPDAGLHAKALPIPLALHLNVDAIRALRPNPDSTDVLNLDVQWHPLVAEDGSIDTRPGADGHAGIIGLHAGMSTQRKSLRRKLAQLASLDVRWIADEPPAIEVRAEDMD